MNYAKPYLIFMCAVWLPWGLICIFDTSRITEIIGVTSVDATGNTDLRVMYGGFQFAVGLIAALGAIQPTLLRKLRICVGVSRKLHGPESHLWTYR